MKIRFLFYKAKQNGKWLDNGISTWTWLLALARLDFESLEYDYSHVEFWMPDSEGNFEKRDIIASDTPDHVFYLDKCFSSTTRGKWNGVRFAPANEVLKHPERWAYMEFEVDDLLWQSTLTFMEMQLGMLYDFPGIFGFFLPWNTQDKNKWYCSEICARIAFVLGLTDKLYKRISPRRLAKVLDGKLKGLVTERKKQAGKWIYRKHIHEVSTLRQKAANTNTSRN